MHIVIHFLWFPERFGRRPSDHSRELILTDGYTTFGAKDIAKECLVSFMMNFITAYETVV
jgi:hypothetical protein